jgi:hypothetical protein
MSPWVSSVTITTATPMAVAKKPEPEAKESPSFMVLNQAQQQPNSYVGLAKNKNADIRS